MRHHQSSVRVMVFLTVIRNKFNSFLPTGCIGNTQEASIPRMEEIDMWIKSMLQRDKRGVKGWIRRLQPLYWPSQINIQFKNNQSCFSLQTYLHNKSTRSLSSLHPGILMALLVPPLTMIRYVIGLCPNTAMEAHESDTNPDYGTRGNLLAHAMPVLRLEGGRSTIGENPAPRQILPDCGIFRKIHNWNKHPYGGNSEAWDPIIKEHSIMSCYLAYAKATQSMVCRPASLL